jgi:hypothetical protein
MPKLREVLNALRELPIAVAVVFALVVIGAVAFALFI